MRDLDQELAEREQKNSVSYVENRVNSSDSDNAYGIIHKSEIEERIDNVEHDKPDKSTQKLYHNVDDRNSLRIPVYADRRQDGRHAGADICTHYERNSHTVCQLSRHGDTLQDTDGGRGTLDDAGNYST